MLARALLPAAAAAVAACGGLNDADYVGDERYRVAGTIDSLAPTVAGARTYSALAWRSTFFGDPGESPLAGGDVNDIEFPAPFALPIFGLPPPKHWVLYADDDIELEVGVIAFGDIVVFEDLDGDQEYDVEGDAVRGTTTTTVVYSHALSEAQRAQIRLDGWPIANVDALVPGFQIGTADFGVVTLDPSAALRETVVIAEPEKPSVPEDEI